MTIERKKNKIIIYAGVIIITLALLCTLPFATYHAGNFFFGEIPSLYNVKIAHFFFRRAAYPIMGKPYPYAFHQLSRTNFIQGNLDLSLKEALLEIRYYPEHKATYYIIALTLGYLNREEEAIDFFSKYIEYNPNTWAGRNDKAWLEFRIGKTVEALETISVAQELYPQNPWVLNTYGVMLMNQGLYNEAELAFEQGNEIAQTLTPRDWGHAYPGNDPRIYPTGIKIMQDTFKNNLLLITKKTGDMKLK